MNTRGVCPHCGSNTANPSYLASVALTSETHKSSEEPMTSGKRFTVWQACGSGKGLTCLVSGWRFAPPRCAGLSVGDPLRLRGAPSHPRCPAARHQAASNLLLFSTRNSGTPTPSRWRGKPSGCRYSQSTCSAPPLLPNPSLKLSPNGGTPGPRYSVVHHLYRGPGVPPSVPA